MLTTDKILEIAKTWMNEIQQTSIFDRELFPKIRQMSETSVPIVLHGIRRSGKTFILYRLMQEMKDAIYLNFEDERFLGATSAILDDIYKVYIGFFRPERPVMLLDEVQNIRGWEKFVARLHHKVKFVVSGSNATLMGSDYATALTGRHIAIRVYPLSFKEYLIGKGLSIEDPYITESRALMLAYWHEYMLWGGFPRASLKQEKLLIQSTFEAILYRDVIPRNAIQNPSGMELLARYLISNPGKPFSYRRLTDLSNVKHEDTVQSYIDYLEKAYLVTLLPRFSFSLRKQAVNQKKCYPADISLTRFSGNLFTEERGRLLETVVCNHLLREGNDVYYWKNEQGKEIDFVACNGLKPHTLIQVCENIIDERVLKREVSALILGAEAFKTDQLLLLTEKEVPFPLPPGIIARSVMDWAFERNVRG
jgi:uncharacterized protein